MSSPVADPAAAARAAVARLSGLPHSALDIVIEPAEDTDRFRVRTDSGRLRIDATSPVAAASGYAAYARQTGVGSVSRFGIRPATGIAELTMPVERRTAYSHRVAYNLTVSGYTTPFFDWDQWQRELDVLAASGINFAHVTLGQEAVWLETFQQFGYTEPEVLAWIAPPSHQPWQWLNNLHSYGGGTTRDLIERRADLGRRIIARMRELGVRPILPGFSGTVPTGFAARNPDATIVPQGLWVMDITGPARPDWLATDSDSYGRVADAFYTSQRKLFDEHGAWAVDLLHEGGKLGDEVRLVDAARGVENALRRATPDYLWVVQAWGLNPQPEFLSAIDRSHVLLLDLTGETWSKTAAFDGTRWALGILPNYGGRHQLYGDLTSIATTPERVGVGQPGTGALVGLTNMAEGVDNNPVVWDLFSDLAWTDEPIDLTDWLDSWTTARYGTTDPSARQAWTILLHTAYSTWRTAGSADPPAESVLSLSGSPVDAATVGTPRPTTPEAATGGEVWADLLRNAFAPPADGGDDDAATALSDVYASTDSVIAAVPSVHANQASSVGPRMLPYPPGALVPALRLMAEAANRLDTPGFRHDLVSLASQVLDDEARRVLPALVKAVDHGDLDAFDQLSALFLRIIDAQDAVLSTDGEFLLGRWVEAARRWGGSAQERTQLVEYAKRLLTVWGERDAVFLTEYANRNWAGLVSDYYGARWRRWLTEVRKAVTGEPTTPVDWYEFGERWAREDRAYATAPSGEPAAAVAAALHLVDLVDQSVPGQKRYQHLP